MKKLLFWLALVSLVSVSFAWNVDLPWFGEYQDWLATYAYTKCLATKDRKDSWTYYRWWKAHTADYSCEWFVLTMNAENWWRNMKAKPRNNNWTTDNWLCQLNSAYHSDFIYSDDFNDPHKQIDYCLEVWENAAHRSKMPRYAHEVRHKRNKWIVFTKALDEPPLDKKTEEQSYPKAWCRRVGNVQAWEYIQLDSIWWRLLEIIRPKKKEESKLFICSE